MSSALYIKIQNRFDILCVPIWLRIYFELFSHLFASIKSSTYICIMEKQTDIQTISFKASERSNFIAIVLKDGGRGHVPTFDNKFEYLAVELDNTLKTATVFGGEKPDGPAETLFYFENVIEVQIFKTAAELWTFLTDIPHA